MVSTRFVGVVLVAVLVVGLALGFGLFRSRSVVNVATPPAVTDVKYRPAYKARTELCIKPDGQVARDWKFADRWMKNQLTHDTYSVDGCVYSALHIVTDDPTLPQGHVRFRKVVVNIGTGPSLEGHSYLSTLINGKSVKMERELLFVEFNGRLRPQARPLPACGRPRL